LKVQVVAAATADDWDYAVLKMEQLDDDDVGLILQKVEVGEHSKWKDTENYIHIYKSYWAQ
jgi:hypothetical protein